MKTIFSLAFLLIIFSSCKKEKAEFTPTTVESGSGLLHYKESNGVNNTNWYSVTAMDGLSLPAISQNPEMQKSVVFGFYNNGDEYGFYSPDNFPKVYGQENWHTRLSVRFRKTGLTIQQLFELLEQHQDQLPPQLILDEWKKGINERNHISHPHDGETYAFRTSDGKLTGLMIVQDVNSFYTSVQFGIWVAK